MFLKVNFPHSSNHISYYIMQKNNLFKTHRGIRYYMHGSSDKYQYLHRSKVPTMHFQKSLPRLPIPELGKTCDRYLAALKPIMPDEKLKSTEIIVNEFKNTIGKELHNELIIKDMNNKHTSYISGPWFDMYLKSRLPVVLNYNPFMAFKDDPQKSHNTQLIRATNMLISALRFLKSLKANILGPEVFHLNPAKSDTPFFRNFVRFLPESISWYGAYLFKAFPLDMSQFKNLFNSTRIPQKGKDIIKAFPNARHILVMRNGYFYVFDVLDSDGNILPPSRIFSKLEYILRDNRPPPPYPIGYLTTQDRDVWADVREHLEQRGNADKLQQIDSALFALVLDNQALGDDLVKSAHHLLHGPAENRWFDKSFQLIITKDGKAAINFEHSWGDGVAVLRFFNEVYQDSIQNHFVGPDTIPADIDASKLVRRLGFSLDERAEEAVCRAKEHYSQNVNGLKLDAFKYKKLTRDNIKNAKLSPDSVVQLAFQMAFFKMYLKFTTTYESCSTSAFKHGRTETVRPATSATKACVEEFYKNRRKSGSVSQLQKMMQDCTRVHNQLTKEAAMGQGFDRHLFALKHLAMKRLPQLPQLYEDPSYIEANHFTLSTSTLSSSAFSGGGFAPVVKDGFGLAYGFIDNSIGCLISSYNQYMDGNQFSEALHSSLDEITDILLQIPKDK